MEVILNRQPVTVEPPVTLAQLLAAQGIPAEGVAVAIDNRVVPRSAWVTTPLSDQMKITVIRAVCGG